MRSFWATLLLPLAVSSAAVKTRRQITPELLAQLISPDGLMPLMPNLFGIEEPQHVPSDKSWDLKPQIQKTATRKLIRWGPFEILGIPKVNVSVSSKQVPYTGKLTTTKGNKRVDSWPC
jgi:hypothetical protein